MDVLGVGVQQMDGSNVFLINHHIPHKQLFLLSRLFFSYISHVRSEELSFSGPKATQPNFKSGSVFLMKQYRVMYNLVNEVYVFLILSESSNPYFFVSMLTRAKKVLVAACKGTDVSASQLSRKFSEVYFGLERVLHGEDASEGVSQKILETSPFAPGPPTIGLNFGGKVYDGVVQPKGPLPVLTMPDEHDRPSEHEENDFDRKKYQSSIQLNSTTVLHVQSTQVVG